MSKSTKQVFSGTDNMIKAAIEKLSKMKQEYENATVKGGIIGISGSGKSSLINAIAGEKIAKTSSTEQTTEPQHYNHNGLLFVDLPGCNTKKYPRMKYIESLKLKAYDYFIIVTANRFHEDDVYLYEQLHRKLKKPCFIVRNKFDIDASSEKRDNNLSEDQTRNKIRKNIYNNLKLSSKDKIYFTSTIYPKKYDLPQLLVDISNSFDKIKKDRFIADMAAWNDEAFRMKREVAEKCVMIYSGLAAANGLNPIPGLDISVDLGLLLKLSGEISHIYGLSKEEIKYYESFVKDKALLTTLKKKVIQYASKYLLEKAIVNILQKLGKTAILKAVSKYIPFVGQAISASTAFFFTSNFGKQLIDESEKLAKEILDSISEDL